MNYCKFFFNSVLNLFQFNPIRTGGVFHQAGGFLAITLEVINVHSRNLVTSPKI